MSWVNSEVRYPRHAVQMRILADHDDMLGLDLVRILKHEHDIVDQQRRIEAIVERYRPELANCQVAYIGYRSESRHWSITVSHPLLPTAAEGCEFERWELIPSAEDLARERAARPPELPEEIGAKPHGGLV